MTHWTSAFVRAWLLLPQLQIVTRRPPLLSDPRLGSVEEPDRPAPILETGNANHKTQNKTKSSTIIALLARGTGATLSEISKATQWQTHSIRAFLTGLRKKGFVLTREQRGDNGTTYRTMQTSDQNAEPEAS